MVTNYAFGAGKISTRPGILQSGNSLGAGLASRMASKTSDAVTGIKRTPTASVSSYMPQNLQDTAGSNVSSKSREINAFGESQTAMKQVQANQKAAKAKEAEEARKAAEATRLSSAVKTSGIKDKSSPASYANVKAGTTTGQRSQLVNQAASLIGTPYAWGGGGYGNRSSRGTGKGTQNVIGVDCSGLTSYVYSTLGIKLARQSDAQLKTAGYRTSIANLQPGDLVGWSKGGHVAMYVGNGEIIESPNVGKTVRRRKLGANENAFGVHIKLPGE